MKVEIGETLSDIAFIALNTFSVVGGLQNFNRRLIRHLGVYVQATEQSECVSLTLGDKPADLPDIPGVTCENPSSVFFMLCRTLLLVRRGVSILLVGHVSLLPIAALAKLVNPKLRIVLFVHGIEVWNAPGYRQIRWADKFGLFFVNRIASVSKYTARIMAAEYHLKEDLYYIFPNAIDFFNATVSDERLTNKRLLTVSRVSKWDREKYVDRAIRAFAQIADKVPGASYEIIGAGDDLDRLKKLAYDLGIQHRVYFRGQVSDAEREAAYQRASLFVLPSTKEGFGIVYLEAWQHRLPVIAANQGGGSEVVTSGVDGIVVNPDDIESMSIAMLSLLTDEELARRFGQNGYDKVAEKYTDEVFGKNLTKMLSDI